MRYRLVSKSATSLKTCIRPVSSRKNCLQKAWWGAMPAQEMKHGQPEGAVIGAASAGNRAW